MAHARQLILNRYRPIAQAGSGGFGTVQVAWDTRIQRKVAIKCIELDEFEAALAAAPAASPAAAAPAAGAASEAADAASDDAAAGLPWDDDRDVDFASGAAAPAPVEVPAPPAPSDAIAPVYDDLAPLPEENPFGSFEAQPAGDAPADGALAGEGGDAEETFEHSLAHVPGLDEARTAAMLSDSSIVGVYDFEVQGTTAYLIMEYVEGITLAQLLRDFDDQLTLDVVAAVFASVARALEVAHENQVLHLDIKPDNILINRQGQVKVTDFGLATLMDASGNGRAGGGTIGYMPPEQMRQEPLDARCDEWALASVTYTMLSGTNPFVAPTLERAQQAIEDAELVLPSLCWDDLDPAADEVIFYALDPDPDERYDYVYEFAEELEPLLGDPQRGKRELAAIVGDAELEDVDADADGDAPAARRRPKRDRIPLRDRITHRKRAVAARAVGALGSAATGALAVLNVPLLGGADDPIVWGIVAVLAVLGAVWPHVGALLAYVALALALALQGSVVLGCVLLVATAAWWYFVGRRGKAAANVALAAPAAGGFGAGQLVPLLAGYSLRPAHALATTAFCVLAVAALAACGTNSLLGWNALVNWDFSYAGEIQETLLALLARPEAWCVAASWFAAAGAVAVFRLRKTRLFAALGVLAGGAVLLAGLALAAWLASAQASWAPGAADVVRTMVPVVVMLAASALLPEAGRDD